MSEPTPQPPLDQSGMSEDTFWFAIWATVGAIVLATIIMLNFGSRMLPPLSPAAQHRADSIAAARAVVTPVVRTAEQQQMDFRCASDLHKARTGLDTTLVLEGHSELLRGRPGRCTLDGKAYDF
jgi:hypothetical protein